MRGHVQLSFGAAVPIRHLAVAAFEGDDWKDFYGSLGRVEHSMDGETFALCGRQARWVEQMGRAPPQRAARALTEPLCAAAPLGRRCARSRLGSPGPRLRPRLASRLPENFSAQPRRVHEVPIARGVVARHLRFVSHEGPLGLSQVVLNREGPNRHLLLPAAERDVYVPVD